MNGKEAQEAGTTPPTAGESAEKPSETRHAEQQHIEGDANNGVDLGPPSSTEEDAVRAAEAEAEANGTGPTNGGDGNSRPKLPRPTGIQPCPRCNSAETKFCYYNNYNIKQPRYYCKGCQRYWTAGGTLRDVPVGAGRRRTKGTRSQDDTLSAGGFSAGSLPSYVDPTLAAVSLAAAAVGKPSGLLVPPMMPPMMPPMIPTVLPALIPPGVIPAMPFSAPVDFSQLVGAVGGGGDPLSKVTANALLTDPAAAAAALGLLHQHHPGALAAKTNVTANQKPQISAASEDGAVEGRRTKRRTGGGAALNAPNGGPEDKEKDQAAPSNHHHHHRKNSNNHANSKVTPAGDGGGAVGGVSGVMPMHIPPYPMDWFAAQHNPQAAVAMQAQMQAAAAAAGYAPPPPPYAVPGMWPGYGYGGFPAAGWPNPAAAAAMYQAGATRTSSGMPASSNGGGVNGNVHLHEQAPPAMPWMAPQWPPMAMPLYGMPPVVPMPPGLMPHMPPTAAGAVAVAAAAAAAGAPSMPDINNNKDNKDNSNKAAPRPNDDVN